MSRRHIENNTKFDEQGIFPIRFDAVPYRYIYPDKLLGSKQGDTGAEQVFLRLSQLLKALNGLVRKARDPDRLFGLEMQRSALYEVMRIVQQEIEIERGIKTVKQVTEEEKQNGFRKRRTNKFVEGKRNFYDD